MLFSDDFEEVFVMASTSALQAVLIVFVVAPNEFLKVYSIIETILRGLAFSVLSGFAISIMVTIFLKIRDICSWM